MRTFLLFLIVPLPLPAQVSQRDLTVESGRHLALVVGNAAYPRSPLRNPVNDARAVAAELNHLGFQTETVTDVGLKDLERTIHQFVARVRAGDLAVFYYAGHGIQIEGENYVVPVDFDARDEADAKYAAYAASRVQERLEQAGARVIVMVLDACRNNPFRSVRSASGGLAAMGGKGSLIAFATAPGRTADDNPTDSNGLFTSHLVKALREPGLTLDQIFNRVRERVYRDSQGKQIPWTTSSVIGDVYLKPLAAAQGNPLARPLNPLAKPAAPVADAVNPLASQPPHPPAVDPAAAVAAGKAAVNRGDFDEAAAKAQEALRANPRDAGALLLLASAYYGAERWELFLPAAREALAAGAALPFLLGHHHTLTGIHAASLVLTRDTILFKPVHGPCNQTTLELPVTSIVSAAASTSENNEIFLNVKLRDQRNKLRNFNFADPESNVAQNASGLPLIVPTARAAQLVGAISTLLTEAKGS